MDFTRSIRILILEKQTAIIFFKFWERILRLKFVIFEIFFMSTARKEKVVSLDTACGILKSPVTRSLINIELKGGGGVERSLSP